jgi:hypothetical protein
MVYVVPDMKLIPQDKTMSCWFASGQMLIQWKWSRHAACLVGHPDPALVKRWGKVYDDNSGITNEQISRFADDLGLEMMGAMTPSPEYLKDILIDYGPVWVNGNSHITVIAGIRSKGSGYDVLVFDPARPALKHGMWHDFYKHYGLQGHTSLDAGATAETSMLRLK